MKTYLCIITLLTVACAAGATDRKLPDTFLKGADLRDDDDPPPDDPPVDNPPPDNPPDDPPPDDPPVDSPQDPPADPTPDPQVPVIDMPVDDTPIDAAQDPTWDNPCDCVGAWDGGGASEGGGGTFDGGSPSPAPLPPQVSNTFLMNFLIKPGHEQNSRFNIKLSLPGWNNALMTPAIFQSSLRTLTLTIGSASFSGDIGAHGKVSFMNGGSYKGQVNPGRNLMLNVKGLNLIELLSLDLSSSGAQTTVENISLTATDLAGETITFYNAATVFSYSVTKQGAKGVASGS